MLSEPLLHLSGVMDWSVVHHFINGMWWRDKHCSDGWQHDVLQYIDVLVSGEAFLDDRELTGAAG